MFGINSSQSLMKKINIFKDYLDLDSTQIDLELLNLKMQLEEASILNFINKTGIGFYDLFDTTNNIDIPNTTATVDTVNKKITFTGSKVLKMLPQTFDSFSNINLNLYTSTSYATSKNEVNNSSTVIAEITDKILNIGDDLFINNTLNRIIGRENNMVTIDKTIKSLQSYNAIIDKTTPVNAAIVSGDTSFNNGDKIVMDTNGNIYVVYFYNSQVYCRKSSDDGTTWTDLGFPLISGYAQFSPSIAIDSLNNLHVVWQGLDSSNTTYTQIKYSKFNGTTWSSWINIQTISAYNQYVPSIAIDSLDNIHVIWYGTDSSNTTYYQIKYSKFNGTIWSSWITIQLIVGYNQYYPSIAIDSLDNLHIIWYGRDISNPTYYQIKYSKFNGTTWSSWIDIQSISGYYQYYPSIAIDSLNNIHVVWYGTDSSNTTYTQIKYSKFNGTIWSSWIDIQSISGYHQLYPSITIDSLNNIHVVWRGVDSSTPSYYQIKYSKFNGTIWSSWINYTAGTTNHQVYPSACRNYKNFTEPIIIWQDTQTSTVKFRGKYTVTKTTNIYSSVANVSGDTSLNNGDKIVIDTNGNIYAVYFYDTQVYCRKSSDDGTTWSDLGLPIVSGYNQYRPSIAIDSLDNLHVVWYGNDASIPSYNQIKYSKFNGTTWSSWINIQPISGYSQYYPSIDIDSLDNLHVVWYGSDASNPSYQQIKYSKFNGTTWSSFVNMQVISSYHQNYPSIVIDSLNNLHVVWQGYDSSNANIQIKYSKFNGTTWSSWINIQTISGYNQFYPTISIDLLDNLHIVWYGMDSSNTTYYQIKYSKFNGTTWSSWVNYTTGTTAHQVYASSCKNYKKFTEPIIIWQDNQTSTVQFRGKFEASVGYIITLTNPVTLISSQKVPIADFNAKQDGTQLVLKAIESDKFIFSLASIDTIVDITIEGIDTILNDIAYSVS